MDQMDLFSEALMQMSEVNKDIPDELPPPDDPAPVNVPASTNSAMKEETAAIDPLKASIEKSNIALPAPSTGHAPPGSGTPYVVTTGTSVQNRSNSPVVYISKPPTASTGQRQSVLTSSGYKPPTAVTFRQSTPSVQPLPITVNSAVNSAQQLRGGQVVGPHRVLTVQNVGGTLRPIGFQPKISATANGTPQSIAIQQTLASLRGLPPNITIIPSEQLIAGGLSGVNTPTTAAAVQKPLTSKDVSRMWLNDSVSLKNIASAQGPNSASNNSVSHVQLQHRQDDEEEAELEEELGVAETYADYMPSKLNIGIRHPDPVVETSSLSSVEPPDIKYRLSLPEEVVDNGDLSALQLEAIVYSCQRHETFLPSGDRAGFLIGDGAGVGKGRTVAGIIYENYLCGRKRALWFSISSDLKVDAERDLKDIGASRIPVHALNKLKYAKISSRENGSIKKGVVFATYSSLIGESQSNAKYRTRMKMLLNWCGHDFDGPIILDECHRAKNIYPSGSTAPTKTGKAVLELQEKLPKARVVYASATGATEPKHMAYMTRLGLWSKGTPFPEFNDFSQAVQKRGVGAMELVAMDLKLRGMYIARQLSFHGVSFKIEEIGVSKSFEDMYNKAVELWVDCRDRFSEAVELSDPDHKMWARFWSCHQRFFKYLCISSKVHEAVRVATEAMKDGKCVVIGLQSTGEAKTLELLEDSGGELNDFVSTAKGVIQSLIEKSFPGLPAKSADAKKSIFDDMDFKSLLKPKAVKRVKPKRGLYKESDVDEEEEDSVSEDGSYHPSSSAGSSSDDDKSDSEDGANDSDSDLDDFNPFGSGGSDDEDPWLKQSAKKRKKSPVKKPKKKKKKVNEGAPSKPAKSHKKSSSRKFINDNDDDDDDDDEDSEDMDELWDQAFNANNMRKEKRSTNSGAVNVSEENSGQLRQMRDNLLKRVELLGETLPPNTLDELIDSLGGPDEIAEMTGRKGRVVCDQSGAISYESRSENDVPLEILNLTEKERFMNGQKLVAIISEAASSGISLQSDKRVNNKRRRVHITLELPWSADRAVQQFGRTHRSNQVNAPQYIFLISNLAGERRFASTVAKRLESLGALTHGDRRATETRDLSQFNFDNKYGSAALEVVMKSVLNMEPALTEFPKDYPGNFKADVVKGLVGVGMVHKDNMGNTSLDKNYNNINKFLNRILGMKVSVQNALFDYFNNTLSAVILQAKRNGRWDLGILDLGAGGENVKVLESRKFNRRYGGSYAQTKLVTVSVERGISWDQALDVWRDHVGSEDGFYRSLSSRQGQPVAILAVAMSGSKKKERLYRIYRPNIGLSPRAEKLANIKKKFSKVTPDEATELWVKQYQATASKCSHMYWRNSCRKASIGETCELGLRMRRYHVLCGSVLSVWSKLENVLGRMPGGGNHKMQIVRLRTESGDKIVGSLIPGKCIDALSKVLSEQEEDSNFVTSGTNLTAANALSGTAPGQFRLPQWSGK